LAKLPSRYQKPRQRKEGRVYIGGGLLALIVIILILIWLF